MNAVVTSASSVALQRIGDYSRRGALFASLFALAACASSGSRQLAVPIEDRAGRTDHSQPTASVVDAETPRRERQSAPVTASPQTQTLQTREQIALASPLPRPEQRQNPALMSLLSAAQKSVSRGEWERARAALERAVKLAPHADVVWRQLAYTHYRKGDFEQAQVLAERALSLAAGGTEGEFDS